MKRSVGIAAVLFITISASATAQVTDTARAGISRADASPRDSTKPPISPRRAFLSSLLLPGYAQSRLDRQGAAMLFSTLEIFSLGMSRKAAQDLREAKGVIKDSVVSTYKTDAAGHVQVDAKTGAPIPATFIKSRFDSDRVKARRVHYEDWIAALIFNHLFAGADAYVAANLWDFHANMAATASARSASISASFAW